MNMQSIGSEISSKDIVIWQEKIFKELSSVFPLIRQFTKEVVSCNYNTTIPAISATRTTSLQLCNQTLADNADLCNRAYEKCLLKENDKNNKEVVRDYTICVNAIGTTRCDLIFYKCDKK